MSARKLQQEMDRVFKRVHEGCGTFDVIYNKLQNAQNQSQKEKYEGDLKREIKKLQKLRDQIKTWIAMNEVRDKKQLLENRRLIEDDMERFKAVEREVKTKAYSKEGLMRSNDPYAKEKAEATDFIQAKVEELEQQIEELEEEQDTLANASRRSKKTTGKQDRISDIDHYVERHKWHISKMEIMINMIENDKLAPESVMDLQEDIQYYVDSNQEVDFAEDEAIYDELNLVGEDENEIVETIVRDDTYTLEDLAQDLSKEAAKEAAQKKKDEKERKERDRKDKPSAPVAPSSSTSSAVSTPSASASTNTATPALAPNQTSNGIGNGSVAHQGTPIPSQPAASAIHNPHVQHSAASTNHQVPNSPANMPPGMGGPPNQASVPPGMVSQGEIGRTPSPSTTRRSQSPLTPGLDPLPAPSVPAPKLSDTYRKGAHLAQGGATAPTPVPASRVASQATASYNEMSAQANLNQAAQTAAQMVQNNASSNTNTPIRTASNSQRPSVGDASSSLPVSTSGELIDSKFLPPGLQDLVQCLDAAKQRLADPAAAFKTSNVAKLVHSSFLNTPDAQISDVPNYYHPQNPYPTPDHYPQDSLPTLEDPAIFKEMHVDTLFYIFYYCQNTHQQYLAAKELKSRSWRFHKQFLTWFQRQEDPTLITDEFEEGTYRFFDFEGSWVQRRKTNFKFEFKYLENEI